MKLFDAPLLRREAANFDVPDEVIAQATDVIKKWVWSLRNSDLAKTKEVSVQGPFLTKIFQDCLGYIQQGGGQEVHHLVAELSVKQDAADAGLGFYSSTIKTDLVVVELKDAQTSLDKKQIGRARKETPVEQGFRYANKIDSCKWVIVSNFKEIRLYSKFRSEEYYESFKLEELEDPARFREFFYLLNRDNLISEAGDSVIDQLLIQSTKRAKDITDEFYEAYSAGRKRLYEDLVEVNPGVDPTVLLEKTQKILDRLVFVCFCEDSSIRLLPSTTIEGLIRAAEASFEQAEDELWKQCRGLFKSIDVGNSRRTPPINAYNGGLFAPDAMLDSLYVRDTALRPILNLSKYDFHSDLDVNVLGHVFEQSVADIESMKSLIEGVEVEKRSTKKKKDGIYYTPEYLTKYLIAKTIGEYIDDKPSSLETIRILDPACGSGAFLNQAHNFLKKAYGLRRVELEAQALAEQEQAQVDAKRGLKRSSQVGGLFEASGDKLAVRRDLSMDWAYANDAALLRHIYGVDLNEESAEITKLSLWLKTAKVDEPLRNLDGNIRVGDSLIDDKALAFEKAFQWSSEFTEVLEGDGGFDIVIGNPPWGAELPSDSGDYISRTYPNSSQNFKDTYKHFIELSIGLLREGGYLGFVTPSSLLYQPRYTDVRDYIDQYEWTCVNLGEKIFEGVNLPCCLIIVKKKLSEERRRLFDLTAVPRDQLMPLLSSDQLAAYAEIDPVALLEQPDVITLDDVFLMKDAGVKHQRVGVGMASKGKTDLRERLYSTNPEPDTYPLLTGSDIARYSTPDSVSLYLRKSYKSILKENEIVYFDPKMMAADPKIVWRQTADKIRATIAEGKWFANTVQAGLIREEYADRIDLHYMLGVLNSSLYEKLYRQKVLEAGRMFPQVKLAYLKELPFIIAPVPVQTKIADAVKAIIDLTNTSIGLRSKTATFLKDRYKVELKDWSDRSAVATAVQKKNKQTIAESEEFVEWFGVRMGEIERIELSIQANEAIIDAEVNAQFVG